MNKLLIRGSLLCSVLFTACDDFLTVYPTTQITEEEFWQDKNDFNNARAGAYMQLVSASVTNKILYWGEVRSDNVRLNQMSNTSVLYTQQAILRPSDNDKYEWADFYKGINYCNKAIEKGFEMTDPANQIDPAYSRRDFNRDKAELIGLRSLYYFYLVRAFRDVPYVNSSISTDAEVQQMGVTSGEAILGDLIDTLEVYRNTATNLDNKGRFNQTSLAALLADMYLWRGCLLKNYSKKFTANGKLRAVNTTDVPVLDATTGDTLSWQAKDGTAIDDAYCDALSLACFNKAISVADETLDKVMVVFDRNRQMNRSISTKERAETYPLHHLNREENDPTINQLDGIYSTIWGRKNSDESIFELAYEGTSGNSNSALSTFFGSASGGTVTPSMLTAADVLHSNMTKDNAERGFSKYDIRGLQTIAYSEEYASSNAFPIHKNIAMNLTYKDLKNLSEGFNVTYRTGNLDANFPIYRSTDIMLIKAEAIVRANITAKFGQVNWMVNHIYARNNPCRTTMDTTSTTTASDLLVKVYTERQRVFVGEGKRWFDLVREAEAGNYYSVAGSTKVMEDLSSKFVSVTTLVKNRMRNIWSFYNPVCQDQMKTCGVDYGGYVHQNPVWQRYSTDK